MLVSFLMIPMTLSIGMGGLYHAGFVVDENDDKFATQTLAHMLLESGENTVHPGGVSRNVSAFKLDFVIQLLTLG